MKFLSKKYRSICKRSAATIALVLVSVSANAGMYFVHSDQVGAPTKLSDSSARVVWRAENRGYGEGVYNDDADGNGRKVTMNVRYPGQYYDAESGLHYNYFRYYDPKLGRYITSDPIGLAGGINTYEYAASDPINYYDENGLDARAAIAICMIQVGLGYYAADSLLHAVDDYQQKRSDRVYGDSHSSVSDDNCSPSQDLVDGAANVSDFMSSFGGLGIDAVKFGSSVAAAALLAKSQGRTICAFIGFGIGLQNADGSLTERVNDIYEDIGSGKNPFGDDILGTFLK